MSNRLDVSFLGRSTARNPITLKSPRRIEHDARWRTWKDRLLWALTGLLLAASVVVMIVCGWAGQN